MTDPTGPCFLSYKRERAEEAALLIRALHDVGVPTWQDLSNLADAHIEEELRRVLGSSEISGGLLWATPEVADSIAIRSVEAPLLLSRADRGDAFFCVIAAAGGLERSWVAEVLGPGVALHGPSERLIRKVSEDPLTPHGAATVAEMVLRARAKAIQCALPPGDALQLSLHTRTKGPSGTGPSLALEWQHRFDGREAKPGAWDDFLLPALQRMGDALGSAAPGRAIEARGRCAIAAATALGCRFVAPSGVKLGWWQETEGRPGQLWSLEIAQEPSELEARTRPAQMAGTDLAVLVSVNNDTRPAFNEIKDGLPLRGITEVSAPGAKCIDLQRPGEAVDIARKVQAELRAARSEFRTDFRCVHLFMAVPLGLAMLIGQLLNTFPEVQTYEFVPTADGNVYRPAARLRPSGD